MAVVLALAGAYTYARVADDLDESLDNGLRARADDAARIVSDRPEPVAQLADAEETFTQVLTSGGRVINGPREPVLTAGELARARSGDVLVEDRAVPGIEGRARIVARPALRGFVVAVGASTDDRDETLSTLTSAFAIGGPIVLLFAAGLGYVLAGAAMRPGLERLRAALERERTFVADASHELRTPLAVLKTELEVAADPRRDADELRAAVRSSGEEVDRLAQLAEDLLATARAESGSPLVSTRRVRVADVLSGARERFARRAADAGRAVVVDVAPATLEARLDPLRVEQAVGNLLDNALRHGAGDVVVGAREDGDGVAISVTDSGAGIPPGIEPFERFARADPARARGGAGLGLAIVRAIARAHGGDATADGATVTIRLPSSSFHEGPVQSGP